MFEAIYIYPRADARSSPLRLLTDFLPDRSVRAHQTTKESHDKRQVHGKQKIRDESITHPPHVLVKKESQSSPTVEDDLCGQCRAIRGTMRQENIAYEQRDSEERHQPSQQLV